jgi:hypothetical protein
LILIDDRPSTEEYERPNLGTFFQKLAGVLQFEVEIVIVRLRAEPDLFHSHFGRFGFQLLLLLLLFEEKLLVVEDLAHGRHRRWRYLNKVKFLLLGKFQRFSYRVDAFNTFANKANL